jgi:SnoaL-like domain
MLEQDALNLAQKWLQDWNHHNLDRILSHYAETIEFTSPFVAKILKKPRQKIIGKIALRNYFAQGLSTYPDLYFELKQILVGADSLVIYYHSIQDLLAAEWMQIDDQGLIAKASAHYSHTTNQP